jgi:hypothetical protein
MIKRMLRRIRAHLTDIDGALHYPVLMAPPLPMGIDVRGEVEMEAYYATMAEVLKRREELEAKKVEVS